MSHTCSCHTIVADPDIVSLLIHASAPPALRRLTVLLSAHAAEYWERGGTLTVPPQSVPKLSLCLKQLSVQDCAQLLAVPCTPAGPQFWECRPLTTLVERLLSPWFEHATQHLLFHAQPIVDLRSGTLDGYEALVRSDLDGQLIGAGQLLAAASAHEQLRAFDAFCRTTAIEQLYPRLAGSERLYINFSPGVVYDPAICLETTFRACHQVGADLGRLVFEITEGEAFPDLHLLKRILERYRYEGARIALDDLGSGHANLTLLKELQPEIVKLDRSLIQGLHLSPDSFRFICSLVEYAHALGIEVVAEGIEVPEELQAVREAGVDYAQGFYLGRPSERLWGMEGNTSTSSLGLAL